MHWFNLWPNNWFYKKTLYDFDDPKKIFLYIKQDTSELVYSGLITKINFGEDVIYSQKNKIYDVEDKREILNTNGSIKLRYKFDYEEVNIEALRRFRHSINFDFDWAKKNKLAVFELVNRKTDKCMASFRYFDYGKRFYFDVY